MLFGPYRSATAAPLTVVSSITISAERTKIPRLIPPDMDDFRLGLEFGISEKLTAEKNLKWDEAVRSPFDGRSKGTR